MVAQALGQGERAVMARRARLAKAGILLETIPIDGRINYTHAWSRQSPRNPARLAIDLRDGPVIVFSDAHYWPGEPTPAHCALVTLIRRLKPKIVFANGDIMDGATISRHDREGWAPRPTLRQELDVCKARIGEIEDAAGFDAELIWNLGNHDARFERHLAMNVPGFEGMPGTTLPEHFPRWTFAMSTMINPTLPNPVMVKHRIFGGVHATYNGAMKSGVSTVTGHLHQLRVFAWGDYRGRRYGVDSGSLADQEGPQFAYREDNPSSGAPGFVVLTFKDGDLLHPELCEVRNGVAHFRGESVA